MQLPEDDEDYLKSKGWAYELTADANGALLIFTGFAIDGARYDRSTVDLMIRIPAQYPNAQLDMFYVDPVLKLAGGGYPNCADQFEEHGGRRWQRFSRHLPGWRVGIDGIPTLLTFANRELRSGT